MTRKDYILIAAALKEARTATLAARLAPGAVDAAALSLANALAADNAAFDRARFLRAAGVAP